MNLMENINKNHQSFQGSSLAQKEVPYSSDHVKVKRSQIWKRSETVSHTQKELRHLTI